MSLPTLGQFLTKLASNPSEAKAFDNCRPDLSRRQHCQLVLSQVENSCSTIANSKKLADARAANARLKAEIAIAKTRVALAKAAIAAKAIAAAPAKPQRELTGHARASAAFAGTANRSATTPTPSLTGHAKVSAFFASQSK